MKAFAVRPRPGWALLIAPLLMHCATHAHRHGDGGQDGTLPALGNEASLVQRANRLAAGDWYTCAVTGQKRALTCWGDGIVDLQTQEEAGRSTALTSDGRLILIASGVSSCGDGSNPVPSSTLPVPMWWVPEQSDIHIDARGSSRPGTVSLRSLWAVRQVILKHDIGCALLVDGDAVCWELFPKHPRQLATHLGISMADPLLRDSLRGATRIVTDGQAWCALRKNLPPSCFRGSVLHDALQRFGDVVDVSGSLRHSCVLRASGAVFCWGDNDRGQLGVADAVLDKCIAGGLVHPCTDRPVAVPLSAPVKQVASDSANCALLANGTVRCWGTWGAKSRGEDRWRRPRQVHGLHHIVQVSLNGSHGCALGADGSVYCFRQRAANVAGNDIVPALVSEIESAREISVGKQHACAVLADRSVWCWGDNQRGQLGDGSCDPSFKPVQALPPHSVSPPIM